MRKTALQLLFLRTRQLADRMRAQEVSNTLWGFGKLLNTAKEFEAENKKEFEAQKKTVEAVLKQTARVARKLGKLEPEGVSNILWAMATLAEKGFKVEEEKMRAMSVEAVRVAADLSPQGVCNVLWAWAILTEKGKKGSAGGMDVDEANVRALSEETSRVARWLSAQELSTILWAWSKFTQLGVGGGDSGEGGLKNVRSFYNGKALNAVTKRAAQIMPELERTKEGNITINALKLLNDAEKNLRDETFLQ